MAASSDVAESDITSINAASTAVPSASGTRRRRDRNTQIIDSPKIIARVA